MKWREFLQYRLAAVVWSCALLIASTGVSSSQRTGGGLASLLLWLFDWTPSIMTLEIANVVLRKLAHLVAYGIEGVLMLRAVRPRGIVHALGWTLLVASLDEINQSFHPTRTGSPADVLLDMVGAFIAVQIVVRRRPGQYDGTQGG